jgi:hypothetical protein
LSQYRIWHYNQLATGDIDPVYPWLREFLWDGGYSADQGASLILSYVAWYNVRSGLTAWRAYGFTIPPVSPGTLPTGTERRGHRDPRHLARHLSSLSLLAGPSPADWLTGAGSWDAFTERALEVHGNGRWAAYKTAELASKVAGAPYVAPDAGHANSSGPRKTLALLGVSDPGGNSPEVIGYLDAATRELATLLDEPDLAAVETSLCDFGSHLAGRHPLGHDVRILWDQCVGDDAAERAFARTGMRVTC